MEILRINKSNRNLWSIYIHGLIEGSILPGDYIQIEGEKNYPILSISQRGNITRIDVLAQNLPEKISNLDFIKNMPDLGTFYIYGKRAPHLLFSLRYLGYELSKKEKNSDIVIVTEATNPKYYGSKITIFAPKIESTWNDFLAFNSILKTSFDIEFNLNRPLISNDSFIEILFPNPGLKAIFPSTINSYALSTHSSENIVVGSMIANNFPAAIYNQTRNTIILSTLAITFPYDFILGDGDNLDILRFILETRFLPSKKATLKVIDKKKQDRLRTIISFENLDKRILFDYLIKKLATMGAFIEKRDDNRLIARMTVASIKGKKPLSFVIKIHDKNIELEFPSTKENMRDLLFLKSTIKELVTEYSKKTLTTARVRTILSLVTECQKKLLTAKDSILVDMSLKDVLDIIHEVIEILKGDIIFKSVSDQIMKELKDLSSELRKNEPIPEKMKHVFEDKIDSWFSLVKEQAERFLEHSL